MVFTTHPRQAASDNLESQSSRILMMKKIKNEELVFHVLLLLSAAVNKSRNWSSEHHFDTAHEDTEFGVSPADFILILNLYSLTMPPFFPWNGNVYSLLSVCWKYVIYPLILILEGITVKRFP